MNSKPILESILVSADGLHMSAEHAKMWHLLLFIENKKYIYKIKKIMNIYLI